MIDVAIVGGGPAGAYCAYNLAENGIYPTIFDHSHPREKPCGGMISPLAQELFPFLKKIPLNTVRRKTVYFIPPSGRKIAINLKKGEVICVCRLDFDQYLLNMALDRGVELKKEKVLNIKRKDKMWKIRTNKGIYFAKKIVGADGVNSTFRRRVTIDLKSIDKGLCFGYFVENAENEDIIFHFLPHRRGYIWVAPRKRNTCIGVACTETSLSSKSREELNMFIRTHYPTFKIVAKWTALIPNVKSVEALYVPLAGKTWAIIGDAAGHVNPISGEGILYALLDGKLSALAIIEGDMRLYEKLWRHAYGLNLSLGIKLRKWVYKRFFLECYCRYLKINSILK